MPLVYTGSIVPIADGEAANATVANRPHTYLLTRTDEAKDFVNDAETLDIIEKGLVWSASAPVTWNGVAPGGDGYLKIGGALSGELFADFPGTASGRYIIPFNILEAYFDADVGNPLLEGEVLVINFATLAARQAGLPVTITVGQLATKTAAAKYDIPVGRVVGDTFMFAYNGGILPAGYTGYPGALSSSQSSSLVYGTDYVVEGRLNLNVAGIDTDPAAGKLTVRFFNQPVTTNQINFDPLITILVNDRVIYADLNMSTNAAVVEAKISSLAGFVPRPYRVPILLRYSAAVEAAFGTQYIPLLVCPSGVTVSNNCFYDFSANTADVLAVGSGGTKSTIQFIGGSGVPTLNVVDDNLLNVVGSTHTLAMNITGATPSITLPAAGLNFLSGSVRTDSNFAWSAARAINTMIPAVAFQKRPDSSAGVNDTISNFAEDGSYWLATDVADVDVDLFAPLNPYLVDGATYTDANVDINSSSATSNLTLAFYSMAQGVFVPTAEDVTIMGAGATGDLTLSPPVFSITVNKATTSYWVKITLACVAASTMRLYNLQLTGTAQTFTRPG